MKNHASKSREKLNKVGVFITQAISQPDRRQEKTNIAMPNDENVTINRKWVEENKK